MICAYCKTIRAENTAPCTNCGAPSPLQNTPLPTAWSSVSAYPDGAVSSQMQNNAEVPESSRASGALDAPAANSWAQWSQESQQGWSQGNSLLPVPYQGNINIQALPQAQGMQVIPAPVDQNIMIAPPAHEEGVVYVPPMYTKPRPIIPRYRIISGLLSVIIVSLLVCGGVGYYAKASGKLDMVSRVLTGNTPAPPSLHSTTQTLPDPPDNVVIGNPDAYSVITSATTTSHLIKGTTVASQTDKIFKPNEPFYLIYSVHPTKVGVVTIKWYMSNMQLPYSTSKSQQLTQNQSVTIIAEMVYATQAEGKVELYWGNELAQTLYFVVRN